MLFGGVLFQVSFLYLLLVVNPSLYLINNYREFFTDIWFFKNYFTFPGNPVEYLTRFITQFYKFPVIGSLLIVFTLAAIYYVGMNPSKSKKTNYLNPVFPLTMLIIMHNDYGHSIKFDLNLLFLFFALWGYSYVANKNERWSFLVFPILLGLLLYITGIVTTMLMVVLALGYVFRFNKRKINYLYILSEALAIAVLSHYIFYLSWHDLIIELKDTLRIYALPILPILLYLSIIVSYFLNGVGANNLGKFQKIKNKKAILVSSLIIAFVILIALTFNFEKKKALLVEHYALEGSWNKVLEYSQKCSLPDRNVSFYTNLALYKTGKIYTDFFNYFQEYGSEGLMSADIVDYSEIVPNQNIFLQLGALSLSVVWGVEASNVYGANPYVLKMLTKAYLASGKIKEAQKTLNLIHHSLFNKQWTENYQKLVDDTTLIMKDTEIALYRKRQMSEAIIYSKDAQMNLYILSKASTTNRMAFDYLMISAMLENQVENFASCLTGMKIFGYKNIPNIFFEGLMYLSLYTDQMPVNLAEFSYDQNIISRFNAFRQNLSRLRYDKEKARKELSEKFGDTYWYYLLYRSPLSDQERDKIFLLMIS